MSKRWVAALVVAALLAGSSGASADPGSWGKLGEIILWLERIDRTLKDINDTIEVRQKRCFSIPCVRSGGKRSFQSRRLGWEDVRSLRPRIGPRKSSVRSVSSITG